MRRAAKVDVNQPDIVKAARAVGASVQTLHTIGKGCPDLLIGYRGVNLVWELKDGLLVPSKQVLTPDEIEWHAGWRGDARVVSSVAQALLILQQTRSQWPRLPTSGHIL